MSLYEDLVRVTALLRFHGVEGEVVDDQEVGADEPAQLGLVAAGEARLLQGLEHAVGTDGDDGVATATGGMADGVGEEGLAYADVADDGEVVVSLDHAQGDQFVQELAVE